jgi:hypothetical protein
LAAVRDYVTDARDELTALAVLRRVIEGGPRFWLGLILLALTLAGTAYFRVQGDGLAVIRAQVLDDEWIALPPAALWLASLALALGWTYLLQGAAGYGLGAYTLAVLLATSYGLLPAMPLSHQPWFLLLPLWLLVQGIWLALARPGRWRWLALLALCWLTSLLTYRSLGLHWSLPGLLSQGLLGAGYWALSLVALMAQRHRQRRVPSWPGLSFAVTLSLWVAYSLLTGLCVPPAEWLSLSYLALHGLLGLVGLFWFWMGLELFSSSQSLVGWGLATAQRLLSLRALGRLLVALWLAWLALACLVAFPLPLAVLEWLGGSGLGRWLLAAYAAWRPSDLFATVMIFDLYPTAALLLAATALAVLRRLTEWRLAGLFAAGLFILLVLWGGLGLFYAFGQQKLQPLGFWPLLLSVGGMFWQVLQRSGDLVRGRTPRVELFIGFLLCLAGVSLVELVAQGALFEQELALNAFNGVLYLGLPYLAYRALYRQKRFTPVRRSHLLVLFAWGLASALPVLARPQAAFTPLVWALGLWLTVWRTGRWDDLVDGVVYGLALGLGCAAFAAHPISLPTPALLPLADRLAAWQEQWALRIIWPWQPAWWLNLLALAASGALLGLFLSLAHRQAGWRRYALVALALVVSGAVLAVRKLPL